MLIGGTKDVVSSTHHTHTHTHTYIYIYIYIQLQYNTFHIHKDGGKENYQLFMAVYLKHLCLVMKCFIDEALYDR